MSTFNRGLDDEFVDALNREYDKQDGWWRAFVDDKDVFLAIRENYVNVYYRGCSLLRLELKDDTVVGKVHYKYLLRPSAPKEYVKVENGVATLGDTTNWFLTGVRDIDSLKIAARPYAGDEKAGVHNILLSKPILDVEIALASVRLDFAALRYSSEVVDVVFFEAKHFKNNELRASDGKLPPVVRQMKRYENRLREHRRAIKESYRRVCCNLRHLKGVDKRHPERHTMLNGSLRVEEKPELIVFGFDGDQKDGKHWKPHRKKLEEQLGGRVRFKGAA